jgi:transcriptional regulator with XRE-family HTH domain
MTTAEAIVALRKHRKQSQQQFATSLDMSISALQNHESGKRPDVRSLIKFIMLADQIERSDLGDVFRPVAQTLLGIPHMFVVVLRTVEERAAVETFLWMLRKSQFSEDRMLEVIDQFRMEQQQTNDGSVQ